MMMRHRQRILLDQLEQQERKIHFLKEKFHTYQEKAEENIKAQKHQIEGMHQRLARFEVNMSPLEKVLYAFLSTKFSINYKCVVVFFNFIY
jgi:hypothetical protein